jgi:hypothetical protein
MTGGGPGSSGPGGSLSSGGGSENRGGAAAAFIRNSYGNVSGTFIFYFILYLERD